MQRAAARPAAARRCRAPACLICASMSLKSPFWISSMFRPDERRRRSNEVLIVSLTLVEGVVGRVEDRLDDEADRRRRARRTVVIRPSSFMVTFSAIGVWNLPCRSASGALRKRQRSAQTPQKPGSGVRARPLAPIYPACRGEGHREADPPALVDLLSDGEPPTRVGARDQAGGRGLLLDERGCLRAPFLRRSRRAREPRDRAQGRPARARASSSPSSTRCRPRTTTCRRSSSPTPSWPRWARR